MRSGRVIRQLFPDNLKLPQWPLSADGLPFPNGFPFAPCVAAQRGFATASRKNRSTSAFIAGVTACAAPG
jgi:hypothetical protein